MTKLYVVILLIYFYAEYIMWKAGLAEAQARIKIARRNINNLKYAEDTILKEGEIGEWNSWLKIQHSEN